MIDMDTIDRDIDRRIKKYEYGSCLYLKIL